LAWLNFKAFDKLFNIIIWSLNLWDPFEYLGIEPSSETCLNGDYVDGINSFSYSLRFNSTVKGAESKVELDDDAVKYIAEMLKYNRSIEAIELYGNVFGYRRACYLAEAIEVNTSLAMLMFNESSGNIGERGIQAISEAIIVKSFIWDGTRLGQTERFGLGKC
jgi:hypothetical protein